MRPSDSPERDASAGPNHGQAEFAQLALENLFEVSPDAIFVTDAHGVIRGANPRAAELFGHSQMELVGQPIENLVPLRFRGRHPQHRENYAAHPKARPMGAAMHLFGLRKDGSEFPVDIMLKPIVTETGPAVLSFVRDATEQREAEEALRRNDLQLRSLVESVSDHAMRSVTLGVHGASGRRYPPTDSAIGGPSVASRKSQSMVQRSQEDTKAGNT